MYKFFIFVWIMFNVLAGVASNGYAANGLKGIETAVLRQDFLTAQTLAEQFLAQPDIGAGPAQEAQYYLGLSYLRLEEFDQAHAAFSQLIAQQPTPFLRDKAYLGLFNADYLNGRYQAALSTIKILAELSPRSEFQSLIYLKIARVHLKMAEWDKARIYLNKIVREFPDSLEIYVARQLLDEKQYYAVQVGAFMDRSRAENLVYELNQNNDYAYIVETVDKERITFYRVRVGQLAALDEAQKLQMRLSRQGYPTHIYP